MRLNVYFILFFWPVAIFAQGTIQPKPLTENRMGVVYNKEFTGDLSVHTTGYTLGATWGNIVTYYKTRYYYANFGEIKHPREFRQNFKDINLITGKTSSAFVYGKQNHLFLLRGGRGVRRYYTEKAKEKGVSIGISYEYGLTLGVLKPYYLDIKNAQDRPVGRLTSIKYSEETAADFLDITKIFGSSGFARGLDEIIPVPGVNGKVGVHFEWGAYDEFIKAAEVGLMLDLFARPIPLMVNQTNRPFFLNLYLNLQLGKRK
jgi:hypothetical protein